MVWFAYRFYKKRKERARLERTIPNRVMEVFNQAEEKLKGGIKEDGTTTNPYKALWGITRENGKRQFKETNRGIEFTKPAVENRELSEQSDGRQDIQDRTTTSIIKDESKSRSTKRKNIRGIVSRIRRRNS